MIYIGGYEADNNQGIYELEDDLTHPKQITNDLGTSYFDVKEDYLITIIKRQNRSGIARFDLMGHEQAVYLSNEKPACFIEEHKKRIYAAYYHDAVVKVWDDTLHLIHEWHYPDHSKCHQIIFFKDMLGIVLLGLDKICFYSYDFKYLDELCFPKESGPRHGVHTQDEKTLYVLSELSNELFVIDMDQKKIIQTLSIKEDETLTTGAAIRLSKDGKHLYTSTRGQNLIKHFVIENNVKEVQCVHLKGEAPRDFNLKDNALIVGYQNTNLIEKYELNDQGNLTKVINKAYFDKIVCVK